MKDARPLDKGLWDGAVDTAVGYSIHMGSMFIKISEYKNVVSYYNKLKNRKAFIKSLPKDVNDPLEEIEV